VLGIGWEEVDSLLLKQLVFLDTVSGFQPNAEENVSRLQKLV
jgi:hypothetical protein